MSKATTDEIRHRAQEIEEDLYFGYDGHECGNHYYSEAFDVSVFEDVQEDDPRYCAWRGDWEAYDTATQSDICDSAVEAVENLLRKEAQGD
jgi:hypothetical protein